MDKLEFSQVFKSNFAILSYSPKFHQAKITWFAVIWKVVKWEQCGSVNYAIMRETDRYVTADMDKLLLAFWENHKHSTVSKTACHLSETTLHSFFIRRNGIFSAAGYRMVDPFIEQMPWWLSPLRVFNFQTMNVILLTFIRQLELVYANLCLYDVAYFLY